MRTIPSRPPSQALGAAVAALCALLLGCGDAAVPPAAPPPRPSDPFGPLVTYPLVDPMRAFAVSRSGPVEVAAVSELLDLAVILGADAAAAITKVGEAEIGDGPRDVRAIDLDGDGRLDLVTADTGGKSLTLLARSEDGGFEVQATVPVMRPPRLLEAADLDGDGRDEIIAAIGLSADDGGVAAWSLQPGGPAPVGATLPVAGAAALAAGDLDGDGGPEIVAPLAGGGLSVLAVAAGVLAPAAELEGCNVPLGAAIADVDADGHGDAVIACSGQALVVFGPLAGDARRLSLGPVGQLYDVIAVDLDADGWIDVAAVDPTAHSAVLWLAPGRAGGTIEPFRHAVTRGPIAIAAADAEGDGDLDLLILGFEERRLQVLLNGAN